MLSTVSVDKFLVDKPLALTLSGLEELRAHIEARLSLFDADPRGAAQQFAAEVTNRAQPGRGRPRAGATGVIPIRGTISQHMQDDLSSMLFGGASTEAVSAQLREFLADDSISNIVLDIDSPGGTTFGVAELAQEIRESRGKKPIVAIANSLAASAAYWLGAQADQFYVTPGGIVGSIGVYGMHTDISKALEIEGVAVTLISAGKNKTEGNPYEPLADDARARFQARIDETYDMFIHDVAKGRGVPEASVRGGYGEGSVVTASQAKKLGMVDGIYTLDQAIAKASTLRVASAGAPAAAAFAEADEPTEPESDDEPTPPQVDEEGAARADRMRAKAFRARAAAGAA